jgi:hypothetical protein
MVPDGKRSKRSQWAKLARHGSRLRLRGQPLCPAGSPGEVGKCPGPPRLGNWLSRDAKQARGQAEQDLSTGARLRLVRDGLKENEPAILKLRKFAASHAARQQLGCSGLQPRLRGRRTGIKSLELLAPPGQLDGGKLRLARTQGCVGKRVVDAQQCVEGGPQLDRPVQPDEIAVTRFSDSRRLSQPSRRHRL